MKLCSFEGCENPLRCKRLCIIHYNMVNRGKPLMPIGKVGVYYRKKLNKICTVEGCSNKHRAKGYCSNHYNLNIKYKEPTICSAKDCISQAFVKKYCTKHYQRLRNNGTLDLKKERKPRQIKELRLDQRKVVRCNVENCENISRAKGFCNKHYKRLKRHGDVNINYSRKYRVNNILIDNINRPDYKYFSNVEEEEILNENLKYNISIDELECLYT